jgi:prolyl oligopeptidase
MTRSRTHANVRSLRPAGRGPMLAMAAMAALSALVGAQGPPPTDKRAVVDTYHGTKVTDEYRWLERWDDPAVQKWSDAQNVHARAFLDALPAREAIRRRLTELHATRLDYSSVVVRGGRMFAVKRDASKEQPWLVTIDRPGDRTSQRVVVDPSTVDTQGGTTIDWYVPSPDGALVAVSLSRAGSERGSVHVFEAATGKPTGEVVPGVHYGTAGGSLAWAGDSKGFYYTRYPRPGERAPADMDFYTQVYFHALRSPVESDRYEIGTEFPRIAEIQLRTSDDGRHVLANVANGDGGEFAQFLRMPSGKWTQLTTFADKVVFGTFGEDCLYLLSRHEAPRGKILRLALRGETAPTMSSASQLIPQSPDGVIDFDFFGTDRIVVTKSRLYVTELVGGPHRASVYTLEGRAVGTLPLPPIASIREVVPNGTDGVLFKTATFTAPPRWYDEPAGKGTGAAPTRNVDLSVGVDEPEWTGVEVVRETAVSRDGTRVPLNIIKPKGLRLDGTHPTLLIGYGGYGVSLSPGFAGANR